MLPAANFLSLGASSFLTDSIGTVGIGKSNFTQNIELHQENASCGCAWCRRVGRTESLLSQQRRLMKNYVDTDQTAVNMCEIHCITEISARKNFTLRLVQPSWNCKQGSEGKKRVRLDLTNRV